MISPAGDVQVISKYDPEHPEAGLAPAHLASVPPPPRLPQAATPTTVPPANPSHAQDPTQGAPPAGSVPTASKRYTPATILGATQPPAGGGNTGPSPTSRPAGSTTTVATRSGHTVTATTPSTTPAANRTGGTTTSTSTPKGSTPGSSTTARTAPPTTTALSLSPAAQLPAATAGFAYKATLKASGGSGSYAWSTGADFPSTMTLTSSASDSSVGNLAFTPASNTASSNVAVDVVVNGHQFSLTLHIYAALTITLADGMVVSGSTSSQPAALGTASVNTAFSPSLQANGGSGNYTWTDSGMPSFLGPVAPNNCDQAATCALSGTPGTATVMGQAQYTYAPFHLQLTDTTTKKTVNAYLSVSVQLAVPNVAGTALTQAQSTLSAYDLPSTVTTYRTCITNEFGVRGTTPGAGSVVAPGTPVQIEDAVYGGSPMCCLPITITSRQVYHVHQMTLLPARWIRPILTKRIVSQVPVHCA